MEINLTSAGKIMHHSQQQEWHGESPDIMQISHFAGQEMIAIQNQMKNPIAMNFIIWGL